MDISEEANQVSEESESQETDVLDVEESKASDGEEPEAPSFEESETPNDAEVAAESPSNGDIDYYSVVYMNNEEFSNIKTVN